MSINVLFINLPTLPFDAIAANVNGQKTEQFQTLAYPLGIMYLSSYLKKQNKSVNIKLLDFALRINEIDKYKTIEDFIKDTTEKTIDFKPDILAFSLIFSTSHHFFTFAVDKLKSFWPKAISIVGGVHATNCTKKLLQCKSVDYVARGEGEISFAKFVEQYECGQDINIKGIYSKSNIDQCQVLEMSDYVVDLDEIPFPDWEIIDMEVYANSLGRKHSIGDSTSKKIASIMASRGCPFQCIFCSSHTVHGRKMRYRSVENVIDEVKFLYEKYGITLFIPEDDLFTVNFDRTIKLLNGLKELNIPDFELQFPNALSVNTLSEPVMDALIDTGMKITNIAIESGSEYTQKYIIKKNCNLRKAKEIVKYFKAKGIVVRCYFILGFPKETKELMLETIEFAKSLGADWCIFSIAAPLIGSEMYEQFVQLGYIEDNIDLWSKAFFQERNFDTKEISAVELKEFAYRSNLECNFIDNINLTSGNYSKAIDIFTDITLRYPFHIIAWYCIMKCYKHLNDFENVIKVEKEIKNLIKTDKRALEMYTKYEYLIQYL